MASDLKIEVFAYTLFHKTWLQMGIVKTEPNIRQIYGEEYDEVKKINEAFDDLYIKPILCRRKLFERIYLKDLTDEEAKSLKSLSECYNWVLKKCDELFDDLTVFERLFATCAFVLEFCIHMHQYNIVDVIKYGHMFWAMYFDKFTKEFYVEGGWTYLKEVAETYRGLDDFFCLFKVETFFELKEAIYNYFYFINSDQHDTLEQKKIHVSNLWIKFRIEEIEKWRNPLDDQPSFDVHEVENILEELKEVFESIFEGSSVFTDTESSDITTDDIANTNEDLGIEHLAERKRETFNTSEVQSTKQMLENFDYRTPPPYNVQDATIFCSKNESASENKEVITEKILETNGNLKNGDDRREIDSRTGTIPASHLTESECNGNIDHLYSRSIERRDETSNAPEVLSIKPMDKPLCYGESHLYKVSEMPNLCSQNAIVNDDDELTHYSKNGDDQTEIANRTRILSASQKANSKLDENSPHALPIIQYIDNFFSRNTERPREIPSASDVVSTIQMPESERDGKTTSDILPTPKVHTHVNRSESNRNGIKEVDTEPEDLTNEQEDRFISIFLRMILVLGDRLGTRFVFQALQSIEESPRKTQVIPDKKKKRNRRRQRK